MKNYSFLAFLKKSFVELFTPVYKYKGIYSPFWEIPRLNLINDLRSVKF
jgi:hypothetical protein